MITNWTWSLVRGGVFFLPFSHRLHAYKLGAGKAVDPVHHVRELRLRRQNETGGRRGERRCTRIIIITIVMPERAIPESKRGRNPFDTVMTRKAKMNKTRTDYSDNPHFLLILLSINGAVLSAIRPASTINASLGLLTNILATKPTLDLPLHNIIATAPAVGEGNDPKRQRHNHKAHNLVEKVAVGQHDGAVVERLLRGIVAVCNRGVVVWAVVQHGKFGVEVAHQKREQ